jgi:predicted lipoprotein with Yx(FWY)xxD motif
MAAPQPPPYTAPNPAEISVFFEGGRYVFRNDDTLPIYTYDKDEPGKSHCEAACATAWPPVIAPASATTVGDWSAIERPDKTKQWAYKGKPVYTYSRDEPGQIRGDGVQGSWHILNP